MTRRQSGEGLGGAPSGENARIFRHSASESGAGEEERGVKLGPLLQTVVGQGGDGKVRWDAIFGVEAEE